MDARLAAAERLRSEPASPRSAAAIRTAIADATPLVVAAGARAAQAHRLDALVPELLAALDRAYLGPDPQCHAKYALIEALSVLGHDDAEVFLRAARHVQMEPVWGGQSDSAPRLRILAAGALAGLGHHALFGLLADLLADPSHEVRSAAARIAGELGGERAALLLRLRLQLPDPEAENTGDYAAAALSAEGAPAVAMVARLLEAVDPAVAAGAALALGQSRLPEALEPLRAALDSSLDTAARQSLITAIALLRSEAAAAILLDLLATGTVADACVAAAHIALYRDRTGIVARAGALARERGDARVEAALG